jgi:hypothetical protein
MLDCNLLGKAAGTARSSIINGHTVLIDPRTHAIIQIVD